MATVLDKVGGNHLSDLFDSEPEPEAAPPEPPSEPAHAVEQSGKFVVRLLRGGEHLRLLTNKVLPEGKAQAIADWYNREHTDSDPTAETHALTV